MPEVFKFFHSMYPVESCDGSQISMDTKKKMFQCLIIYNNIPTIYLYILYIH